MISLVIVRRLHGLIHTNLPNNDTALSKIQVITLRMLHERTTQPLATNSTSGARGAKITSPKFPRRNLASSGRHDARNSIPESGTIVCDTYRASDSATGGKESTENRDLGQYCCLTSVHAMHQSGRTSLVPCSECMQYHDYYDPSGPCEHRRPVSQPPHAEATPPVDRKLQLGYTAFA